MNEIDKNAKIIWDYMLMKHELRRANAIIVLGSNDDNGGGRTYKRLVELGYNKYVIKN